MDIVTLITIIILISIALALIIMPVWQWQEPEIIVEQSADPLANTLDEYHLRYEIVLTNIKELMFDYEVGKVSSDDYHAFLNTSKLEAAKIRQQIDHLTTGVNAANQFSLDAKAEMMIKQAKTTPVTDETVIKVVETELKHLKETKIKAGELSCLNCGQPHQPDDAFCAGCGEAITLLESSKRDGNFCPECGHLVQANDAFCAKCGQSIQQLSTPSTNNPVKLSLS
ncbi:zinc ribbon domain-containing protein [Anaerolineales bacterium HSG24]|nr:zinc ribbon domain-containing protein [Anaerolineales bacterium HSG24]